MKKKKMEPRGLSNEVCLPSRTAKAPTVSSPFSVFDVVLIAFSIGSYVADVGTDVVVIIQYYRENHIFWMLFTLSLVCVPSIIVQIFSMRWYIIDGAATKALWVTHILQLAIFNRYIHLLRRGFQVRKSKCSSEFKKFNEEQSDICMLRLFESFMESAPQLVLQLYIMMNTEEWNIWTGLSAVASVFSLSWGISVYSKAMRTVRPEKKRLTWCGLILQAFWRIGTVSSRVIAMVLFAVAYGSWLLLFIFLHWICMTAWVIIQQTDFCTTWWEERLYNCIVGTIYCFCFFNLKEGQSRWRMTVFYSLTMAQNVGLTLAYFFSSAGKNSHYKEIALALVPTGMAVGLSSMLLYYRFFHPSGPINCCNTQKKDYSDEQSMPDDNWNLKVSPPHCNLKTCRKSNFNANVSEIASFCNMNDVDTQNNQANDMNESLLSVKSNRTCLSDLHRSHSQNCGVNNQAFASNMLYFESNSLCVKRDSIMSGSLANHYKNVNYNFCTAVAFGQQSSEFHCSCLVLLNQESVGNEVEIESKKLSSSSHSLPDLIRKTNFSTDEIKLQQQSSDVVIFHSDDRDEIFADNLHSSSVLCRPANFSLSFATDDPKPVTGLTVCTFESDYIAPVNGGVKQDEISADKSSASFLDIEHCADYDPIILKEHVVRLEITAA